ncbi:winged helix-turn-helix transcriptional regulator, partial [Parvibaculum sp.]|uniref:winged helix-turn-helix transcriptional regulator n=1 Tax=Parvibaculum sp. TaxID=2024848 RepID=UPI0034A016E0
ANRSKTIYSLTEKGRDFLPIILEMTAWSVKHDALTNVSPSFLDSFRTEKDRMMEIILSNLK